jgi:FkbM family methyltransferase
MARDRFADQVRDRQLELVNVAVAPERGTAPFWICDTKTEWNSFDRRIASRWDLPHHAIDVQCRPFRDLLEQYGVPSYLKIDIEGHDHYCVADLTPDDLPAYVSLEMDNVDMLFALRDLGYTGFKLITQNDHSQLVVDLFSFKALLKRRLRRYPVVRRLRQWAMHRRMSTAGPAGTAGPTWQFASGSSGPFGEDTAGHWQSFDEAVYTWVTFKLGRSHYGKPSLSIWHDVHATRLVRPPELPS